MSVENWKDDTKINKAICMRQVALSDFLYKGVRLDRFV